jgi:nucleotide-binding universal stress UspA family protein
LPITDLLVHVDTAPSWPARVAAAIALAKAHPARIIGLAPRPQMPTVFAVEGASYAIAAEFQALGERELAHCQTSFEQAMAGAGLEAGSEWRVGEGDAVTALGTAARFADLTVMSQGDPDRDTGFGVEFPGDVALASGRPVLVVPFAGWSGELGRRVLVGWNGSREAARAIADAKDILRGAEQVAVLTISEAGIRETAGQDLARYLTRQGVEAEVVTLAPGGMNSGELMLRVALERGSDLIVAGCYGHSRLREAVLGGATRSLLRTMTIPVLMSH